MRVTTDRRGFAGGTIMHCAGPWRTSGEWWVPPAHQTNPTHQAHPTYLAHATHPTRWDRDEWDVSLGDGAVYRIFQDRERDGWFIDAIVD